MAFKKGKKGHKKVATEEQETTEPLIPAEATLESQFEAFAQFNDLLADGKTITLKKNDVWMAQAELLDMKRITTTDTGVCWIKYKKRCLNFEEYSQFLQDLAEKKDLDLDEIVKLLIECGNPGEKPKKKKKGLEDKAGDVDQLFGEKK